MTQRGGHHRTDDSKPYVSGNGCWFRLLRSSACWLKDYEGTPHREAVRDSGEVRSESEAIVQSNGTLMVGRVSSPSIEACKLAREAGKLMNAGLAALPPRKEGFTKVPNRFFEEFLCHMKPVEAALLLAILHRTNFHPEREIEVRAQALYQEAGISPNSFHPALAKLCEAEMVVATIQKKRYVITCQPQASWKIQAFKGREGKKKNLRYLPEDVFSTGLDYENT